MDMQLQDKINKLSKDNKELYDVISMAFSQSEFDAFDSHIKSITKDRNRFRRPVYIDLNIDRTSNYQKVSMGAANIIRVESATDNAATVTFSYDYPEPDASQRFRLVRGKEFHGGFRDIYIYNDVQANKSMTLLIGISLPSFRVGLQDDSGETANSDLVSALGNSQTATCAQVAVGTTTTVVKAQNTSRKRITLINPSGTPVLINIGANAALTHAHLLPNSYLTLNTTAAINAIVAAGSVTVSYIEE